MRHHTITKAPTGHRVGFRETIHKDRALCHTGQAVYARKLTLKIVETAVDLIGDNPAVMPHCLLSDMFQIVYRHDTPGWITG